ncbi:MAG: caspase family protein [Candidatus Sumerlaeia bacterium]|nr:caspase family protein [Candidatus Sumerlaeia bacterium]
MKTLRMLPLLVALVIAGAACSRQADLYMPGDHVDLARATSAKAIANAQGSPLERTWLRLRVRPETHRNTAAMQSFLSEAGLKTETYRYDITELVHQAARANVYSVFADPGARTRDVFTGNLEIYRSQLVLRSGGAEYRADARFTIFDDRGGNQSVWSTTASVDRFGPFTPNELPRIVPETLAALMQQLVEKAAASPEVAQACDDYLRNRQPQWAMPGRNEGLARLPAPSDSGKVYALLVGVGDYANPGIPALRYAASDARAMQEALVVRGIPAANIRTLTNSEATLRAIRSGISTHLGQALEEDTVLLYFSCHGSADPDTLAARNYHDGFEKFLLPHDADPSALTGSGLAMSELQRDLANLASRRIVLMVDSCYAGDIAEVADAGGKYFRNTGTTGLKALNLVDDYVVRFVPDEAATSGAGRAVVVLAASQANQVSREDARWNGSLYTHYLVKGIAGEADSNGDGVVTVEELHQFARERVARESANKQTPILFPSEPPFPIAVTPRR